MTNPPAPRSAAVILAGGHGTRLWPISRRARPKQFLDLTGSGTMVGATAARLGRVVPADQVYLVLPEDLAALARTSLPQVASSRFIVEPAPRGTAAAVALAIAHLAAGPDPPEVVLVTPADHWIPDDDAYARASRAACRAAREQPGHLVGVGLVPTAPSPRYGYFTRGASLGGDPEVLHATRFIEKPQPDVADGLIRNGALWNTGGLAGTVAAFSEHFGQLTPALATPLERLLADYAALPVQSIDHAILERCTQLLVVEGRFTRVDLGGHEPIAGLWPADEHGNRSRGPAVIAGAGNIVHSDGALVALSGVQDLVVIATGDVVLVYPKGHPEALREIARVVARSPWADRQ